MPPLAPGGRYSFANGLRGLAALCVVANHLTGVYWLGPQLVATATFSIVVAHGVPAFAKLSFGPWYNLGPFGVALFFLISGFVIPISLERQSSPAFLIGRVFRIYPTYVLAFIIEIGVIAGNAHVWARPFTYSFKQLLANAFLVTDIADVPSIDLVNWTLTVEWKFYLLMALLAPFVRRGSLIVVYAIGLTIVGVSRFSHDIFTFIPSLGLLLRIFESNALYVLFMLIGVVFSYHVRRRIGSIAAAVAVVALFALFFVCWPLTFFRGEYPSATYNYAWALLLFTAAYMVREHVRPSRLTDFFAAVSYPLYLVHSLVGYTLLTLLLARGANALVATVIALCAVVALAFILHVVIERPSQRFGKRLAAKVSP